MAYRFNGAGDLVEFALGTFNGYTAGAWTMAMYVRWTNTGGNQAVTAITNSPLTLIRHGARQNGGTTSLTTNTGFSTGPTVTSSVWELLAVTRASGTVTPRWHLHNGTSWAHSNGTGTVTNETIASSDRLSVGAYWNGGAPFWGDVVCAGIKKADTSDATIETLSRFSFPTWVAFGFDWLIGFNASLEVGGILQDQSATGTGDEIAIVGTTTIADPTDWSWTAAPAFIPQISIIG